MTKPLKPDGFDVDIDLEACKRKAKTDEYLGTRVSVELKQRFDAFVSEGDYVAARILTRLIEAFLDKNETKK